MKRFVVALAVVLVSLMSVRVLGQWGGNYVKAADLDPRAELTIQVSPAECVLVHNRVMAPGAATTSEAESDAVTRIGKACDFAGLEAVSAAAAKMKKPAEFSTARTSHKLARDALDALVSYLVPSEKRPVPVEMDAPLRTLRLEMREVLAGRDPYGAQAPKKP